MRSILLVLSFMLCWSFISLAQVAAPVVPAAPVTQAAIVAATQATGIMGWVDSHGGFQMAVLLLVGIASTLLSAFRSALLSWDGIAPGADIPANLTGLTWINKVCVYLGRAIDFLQGNLKH